MKKLFIILFTQFFLQNIHAQEDISQKISNKLSEYAKDNKVEKVYLHTDKPYYLAGENIWIKAYLVEGIKHLSDSNSVLLYVDLVHNQSGKIVQNIILKLNNSLANGQMTTLDSLKTDAYTLRAYTNWMRNFDENFFFKQDIEILNPAKPNTFIANKTDFDVQFFPEGGNLVDEVQTKIAFKVINSNGKSIDCQGVVIGNKNDTVTLFTSEKFGMGTFRLRPKFEENYKAIVTFENQTKTFQLPSVEKFGHVLSLDNLTANETVTISIKSKLPENLLNQEMLIVAQSRGNTVFFGRFKSSNSKTVQAIPKAMLPDGIVQFTVFDAKGTPFAERIIYNQAPKLLNISVNTDENIQKSKSSTTLTIQVSDQNGMPIDANISMAVTDGNQVITQEFAPNIRSYFSLCADIKGKIESPSYYFDRKNPNTPKHLDLLMLTQGWRRFSWKNVLEDKKVKHDFLIESKNSISDFSKIKKTTLANTPQQSIDYQYFNKIENTLFVNGKIYNLKGKVNNTTESTEGIEPVKEFYEPKYEDKSTTKIDDCRSTIYWNPNIEVKKGIAKVTILNTSEKTKVNVIIQGKNPNGALGFEQISYNVE